MNDRPLSRRDAERILAAPAESGRPVGESLEALRAPGTDAELRREDAAVAAFHVARLAPAPSTRSAGSLTAPRAAAVRAVVATGLVVAVTSGGFALAATGHLPVLPDLASDTATEAVASSRTSATQTPSATPTRSSGGSSSESGDDASDDSGDDTGTGAPSAGATSSGTATETATAPTPDLAGLCRAFQAHDRSGHGNSLASAAFTALATAAGGEGAIAIYCVTLVGEPPATGRPTSLPTQAATGKPSAKPTQAATGKPTAKPSHAATGKPTAQPTPTAKPTPAKPTPAKPTPATPTGKPSTAPSSPAATGKPADAGKPSDTGKPAGTGKPGTAGKH